MSLEPGTLVVCKYRMCSVKQPWLHEIYVGMVLEPGDNAAEWNGSNSERHYCEITNKTKVQYPWGIMHDSTDSLIPITPEESALSFRDKISRFLGNEALQNYDRAMGIKEPATIS